MPSCCCFHSYALTPVSGQDYRLTLPLEGYGNLTGIVERSRLVSTMSRWETRPGRVDLSGPMFALSGVKEPDMLLRFLDLLKNKIIVDLTPQLDECYALGPYTVFDAEQGGASSKWGDLVYRAKYRRDSAASSEIRTRIEAFIEGHILIRTVNAIVAAPKSDPTTPDLVGSWVQEIASNRNWRRLHAIKNPVTTGPQKSLSGSETEADLIERVAHSITLRGVAKGDRVLVLDDTIRSGGTLVEIARSLREAGAREVYGLSVAKDAKFTYGGVDLGKERWG